MIIVMIKPNVTDPMTAPTNRLGFASCGVGVFVSAVVSLVVRRSCAENVVLCVAVGCCCAEVVVLRFNVVCFRVAAAVINLVVLCS